MSDSIPKPIIRTDATPTVMRIVPELAVEIGLNESIMLLQIAHWISITDHLHDGRYWTYQSVRDMQVNAFPFWGVATINRTIKALEDAGFVVTGNYNQRKGDKTRWFSLCVEKLQELRSISIIFRASTKNKKAKELFQNGTPSFQNGTASDQNGTTLPEISTETSPEREPAPSGAALPAHLKNMQLQNTGMPLYSAYLAAYEELNLKAPLMRRRDDTVYEVEGLLTGKFTPEQVKAFCIEKLKVKPNYHFRFLSEDLPGWVNTKAKPAAKPHTMSPAAVEPEQQYMTPEQFKALKEVQS